MKQHVCVIAGSSMTSVQSTALVMKNVLMVAKIPPILAIHGFVWDTCLAKCARPRLTMSEMHVPVVLKTSASESDVVGFRTIYQTQPLIVTTIKMVLLTFKK